MYFPRSLVQYQKPIDNIKRHAFGDASIHGVCAAVYAEVMQAPWWGGHFKRLIGLFKYSFYKSVGKGPLSWDELCEVVLDIEVSLNHRPLSHVEGDPQFPTQTRSSLLFLNANILPELEPHRLEDRDLRKGAKFLKATNDTMWRR